MKVCTCGYVCILFFSLNMCVYIEEIYVYTYKHARISFPCMQTSSSIYIYIYILCTPVCIQVIHISLEMSTYIHMKLGMYACMYGCMNM